MLYCKGLVLRWNISRQLVLSWVWRRHMIGTGHSLHQSTIRTASQSRRRSNLGSSGKPICSSTWHKSLGNNRGVGSTRGRLLRWTLSSKWNKDVIISSDRLNQKPSDMRYRASKMAPLLWTICWSRKILDRRM